MWPLSLGTQQAGLVESFRFPRSEPCDDDDVQFLFHSASPLVNLEVFFVVNCFSFSGSRVTFSLIQSEWEIFFI